MSFGTGQQKRTEDKFVSQIIPHLYQQPRTERERLGQTIRDFNIMLRYVITDISSVPGNDNASI